MKGMAIGEVGWKAGIAPSAIRYYERTGLLPKPARQSGRRRYEPDVLGRLEIIRIAREAGFTIAETKMFLAGFPVGTTPSARWRALAANKMKEIDATLVRAAQMKKLLVSQFNCRCETLDHCASAIARKRCS
jgi:DNA-binding transcriptional MerR regulator